MNAWSAVAADLPDLLAAHVRLTLLSLGLGLAISLPLGIAATRNARLETFSLAVASVLQTIPGLALLALMVPLLGFVGSAVESLGLPAPPTIGFLPAVLALSLYSVLPMLRNTVTGIAGVDPALREAARGVGMSPREALWQVELPLALPTIVAGIRTATVWVVGMATLATPVGGTSLGNPIFAGLQTRNLAAVIAGSLAAAALALCLDGLVRLIELGFQRRASWRIATSLALLTGLGAWSLMQAVEPEADLAGHPRPIEITIGSKPFTEQYILAALLEDVLMEAPGVRVRQRPSLGSTVAFDGLVAGDLDVYVDYSGTLWTNVLGRSMDGQSRAEVLSRVRETLPREYDIRVAAALGFENTYALAMREGEAARLEIDSIGQLAAQASRLEILGDYEFFERPEWSALERRYGLRFRAQRAMDSALMYEAIRSGQGDVISAYSTDGRIAAYALRVLRDDRNVIPPYDALVLVGRKLWQERPGLVARLAALEGTISARAMRGMNAAVDLEGRAPAAVAEGWWSHRQAVAPAGAAVAP